MGYKEEKELFVSGQEGGSITRINLVCFTAISTYALWSVAHARVLSRLLPNSLKIPFLEFLILVFPLLLALTSLSAHPLLLNTFLLTLAILSSLLPSSSPTLSHPPLSPELGRKNPSHARAPSQIDLRPFARPFVTSYRAIMMVMTVLSILAVDFPSFPREFAKAETWGTSLMDLGVGSFVFSLGLVSALPLLRGTDTHPYLTTIWRSFKSCLPLVVLGLVRVVMVKGVDYPEHVTEYGVHWNFFFTLALLPVFGAALVGVFLKKVDLHWVGLLVSVGHQLVLSLTPLQTWTLEAERTGLVSQNKEGLVSFVGYLAIYLLGLASGLYVLPPSPSFFSVQSKSKSLPPSASAETKRLIELKRSKAWTSKPGKLANLLGSYAVVWWTVFWGVRGMVGGEVSRRLANLPYVLWITAFNTSFLFLYLAVHLLVVSLPLCPSSSRTSSPRAPPTGSGRATAAPAIFEAINRNGLVVFLVANLLTGLTNVSLRTMYASDQTALVVLTAYSATVVGVAWVLKRKRVKLA
ncbi:hypothetical protein JCM8547_006941 [Rhodosporidiobolus lusitaniae]